MPIGFTLMGEGMNLHTPKGYIYSAMAFSFGVGILNIREKQRSRGALTTCSCARPDWPT